MLRITKSQKNLGSGSKNLEIKMFSGTLIGRQLAITKLLVCGRNSKPRTDAPHRFIISFYCKQLLFSTILAACLISIKQFLLTSDGLILKMRKLDPREFVNTTPSLIICDSMFSDFSSAHTDYSNIPVFHNV